MKKSDDYVRSREDVVQEGSAIFDRNTVMAIIIGVVALLLLALIIIPAEYLMTTQTIDANMAPPTAAVGVMLILLVISFIIQKVGKRNLVSKKTMVIVYNMIVIGALLFSHGMFVMPEIILSLPSGLLRGEADPASYEPFIEAISPMVMPQDEGLIQGYLFGSESAGLEGVPWGLWIGPIIIWSLVAFALYWVFLCICLIVRKMWTEYEHVAFPLTVPIAGMLQLEGKDLGTKETRDLYKGFWKNRLMWVGAIIVLVPSLFRLLHVYFPAVPNVVLQHNLGPLFFEAGHPLTHLFVIVFHPVVLGISYLVPLNVLFSLWVGAFVTFANWDIGYRLGVFSPEYHTGHRYAGQAIAVVVAIFLIWQARHEFKRMLMAVFSDQKDKYYEENEIMPVKLAFWTGVIALAFILLFTNLMLKVPMWGAIIFFAVYFAMALTAGRARAVTGVPGPNLSPGNISQFVPALLAGRMGPQGTGGLAPFFNFEGEGGFNILMGASMDAYKLSDVSGIRRSKMTVALVIAFIFSVLAMFIISLNVVYSHGIATMPLEGLIKWILGYAMIDGNYRVVGDVADIMETGAVVWRNFAIGGGILGIALSYLKMAFSWWPLEPIAFAIVQVDLVRHYWINYLIVWVVKMLILRYGGPVIHKKATIVFIGLIIGYVLINVAIAILRLQPIYGTF